MCRSFLTRRRRVIAAAVLLHDALAVREASGLFALLFDVLCVAAVACLVTLLLLCVCFCCCDVEEKQKKERDCVRNGKRKEREWSQMEGKCKLELKKANLI